MKTKMVLPKGRMLDKVIELLDECGISVAGNGRNYRPNCSDANLELKLLKSQNIPQLVSLGQHHCGFAGSDWVEEQAADVINVLDLELDPVSIVAAIPEDSNWEQMKKRKLIAVSEYERLCCQFLDREGVEYTFVRSFGATEVFPPEDADLVVDNTATGTTLVENRLKVVATLMKSSTQFIANRAAMEDPRQRDRIENIALIFRSILDGRSRVLLEMNCAESCLSELVQLLPAMKAPSVAKLFGDQGFAVKAAVPRREVKDLVPLLRSAGATDILELDIRKVIA
ncbi:MAG: ATP phosphoribosyltransferase [Acidobacteria bacterium]|nr:ATP phosphoribosyltransferase [Acidobacteriota bacterium]